MQTGLRQVGKAATCASASDTFASAAAARADAARRRSMALLSEAKAGGDPASERDADRKAATMKVLGQRFDEDRTHGALRVRTSAQLGAAIIPVQIDIDFGDAVTPAPVELEYPVLLDHPPPTLNAYPRDTVAAEKFEAIVALDLANSRMKDFYDLLAISRLFAFEGVTLAAAIRATFERRATAIPRERPPSLTHAFSEDPQKLGQWRSFLARDPLLIDEPDLRTVIREVGDFIMPAARAAIHDRQMPGRWTSDAGWRPAT